MSRITAASSNYAAIVERAAAMRKAASSKVGAKTSETKASFQMPDNGRGAGMAEKVGKALDSVSDAQNKSDQMIIDMVSGKDVNLHNTMIELEKADIALKYTVQLRNRALSAYEELMRMQI